MHGLDLPVLPRKIHQRPRASVPAGNVIACFFAVISVVLRDPLNRKYTSQSGPFLDFRPGNIGCFTADPLFNPPCVLFCRLAALPLIAVDVIFKKQANVRQQGRLIFLQAEQIIPLLLHDPRDVSRWQCMASAVTILLSTSNM